MDIQAHTNEVSDSSHFYLLGFMYRDGKHFRVNLLAFDTLAEAETHAEDIFTAMIVGAMYIDLVSGQSIARIVDYVVPEEWVGMIREYETHGLARPNN
jgi:hypothetical protein